MFYFIQISKAFADLARGGLVAKCLFFLFSFQFLERHIFDNLYLIVTISAKAHRPEFEPGRFSYKKNKPQRDIKIRKYEERRKREREKWYVT